MLTFKAVVFGDLAKIMEDETSEVGRGLTRAVGKTGDTLKNELRAQTRRAGLGRKLEKAWRFQKFPRSGRSLAPVALVFSKATRIHAAFDRGGTIKVKNAEWLVIPLGPALRQKFHLSRARSKGSQPRKHSEVDAAIRRFGKLRFVRVDSQTALLVADNATKTGRIRKSTRRRKGSQGVPIFLLKRQVRLRKSLDIQRVFNSANRVLAREVARELGRGDAR